MDFIADGLGIVASGGNEEVQRLHSGIAGVFGHDIKELSVGLGVKLIEYHTMGIETVLVADVSGKHLVDTARGKIDEPLLGIQNFDSFGQCWAHTNHVGGHIENDGGLLAVGSTTIYLGAFLAVAAGQEQGNCGC